MSQCPARLQQSCKMIVLEMMGVVAVLIIPFLCCCCYYMQKKLDNCLVDCHFPRGQTLPDFTSTSSNVIGPDYRTVISNGSSENTTAARHETTAQVPRPLWYHRYQFYHGTQEQLDQEDIYWISSIESPENTTAVTNEPQNYNNTSCQNPVGNTSRVGNSSSDESIPNTCTVISNRD